MISYDECIRRLTDGDRLMVTRPRPDIASDKTTYGLVECGKNVGARTFSKLMAGNVDPETKLNIPIIEPVSDGLFPDIASQTYKIRALK